MKTNKWIRILILGVVTLTGCQLEQMFRVGG